MSAAVRRRFLQLPGRQVHYYRAGEGPPAVLVHSSPASARLLMKEIGRLSRDHTVFAFDTPGFGLSDPLPLGTMEVADLADALADALAELAMPRCPVFGTHTGAAIALELGVRHPERVTGLVLDGVPAFTDDERARFFGDYFPRMPPSVLGGHYAEAWTRFRDQSLWFPWPDKRPQNLNEYDLGPPHSTHLWVSMFFDAAEHYAPAYKAASHYGGKALTAAAALTVPAVYTATTTDMLYPHLDRLPPMKAGQRIASIGTSYEAKRELTADSFAAFGADGPPPADRDSIGSVATAARQFVTGSAGNLHLRWCGDRGAGPLLLIHDAPGSSEQLGSLIEALGRSTFVIAPDLPGNGESDPFATVPDLAAFARELVVLLDRLDVATASVLGIGFGSSVALELARAAPGRVSKLALCGLALPDGPERERLAANLTPPIPIEPDGAHWYRTWLMLRDWQVYWPWFDRTRAALRRVEADFGARPLHRWTMDVMRARDTYHHLIQAALAHDAEALLASVTTPLLLVRDPLRPLSVYDDRLAQLRPDALWVEAADETALSAALA